LLTTVGSDSHISSTIGRCTNMIDTQNTLDDVIYAMKKGKIFIEKTEYITRSEILEHIRYKIENSKEYIDRYVKEFYPKYFWLFNVMYKSYMFTKKSIIWDVTLKIALFGLRRISYKINFEGYDPYAFRTRDIPTITKMIF